MMLPVLAMMPLATAAAALPASCDLLLAGGRVVDGTGAPWFRADVCVVGDRIAAVGNLDRLPARRRIEARRLVVAPGFIDMLGQSEYNVLVDPRAASKITQGITTELTGEGGSIAPVNERLQYVPDRFASTEEIVALAKVAARYGGSYITHQRSEGDDIDTSLDEVFRIAREARLPAQIYHLKTSGKKNWGRMPHVLRRIEQARQQGLDVSADMYPYTASSNSLDASLPLWVREGGRDRMLGRLRDPATRERAKASFLEENPDWPDGGASRIMVVSVLDPALKKYEGKTLEEIGREEGKDPWDVLVDLVLADKGNVGKISFSMSEEDVRSALRHPLVSIGTDSGARATDGIYAQEKSHPRAWGSMARILGRYVREERLLALEEAVRKLTSLPASRMGLHDRGLLRPGMMADLVAFDPDLVQDRSTFADPFHYSEGIPYVAVNGRLVVDGGRLTDERPGRVLRGPGGRR